MVQTYTTSSSTFTGSYNNITCKILIASHSWDPTAAINILQSLLTTYGGSNIQIINSFNYTSGGINTIPYDSTIDVVVYENNNPVSSQTLAILDQYYNAGKGVVLTLYQLFTSYKANVTKLISSVGGFNNDYTTYSQSSSDVIFTNITTLRSNQSSNTFTLLNGSTGIGSLNGNNAMAFLDDSTFGRRVDFNYTFFTSVGGNPNISFTADTSTSGIARASL